MIKLKVPEIPWPPFHSILVTKQEEKLQFMSLGNYETRNESVMHLITMADRKYNFPNFDWLIINTDDSAIGKRYHNIKIFSFCTATDDYTQACPDWIFDHWKQIQLDDYEETCNKIAEVGSTEPETNMLGWRGAASHPNRNILVNLNNKMDIDAEFIRWDRSNPDRLTCVNYVSLPDHPKKWRYMIDIEGAGYSARLKLFFFSKRVLFLPDRPYKEWYFSLLKPLEHYVPISRDMSNLLENLSMIKNDLYLENKLRHNAFEFAQKYLTREAALARWNELLG